MSFVSVFVCLSFSLYLFALSVSDSVCTPATCLYYMQVKVLRLLRVLGHGDNETSDAMNDILAQVGLHVLS